MTTKSTARQFYGITCFSKYLVSSGLDRIRCRVPHLEYLVRARLVRIKRSVEEVELEEGALRYNVDNCEESDPDGECSQRV